MNSNKKYIPLIIGILSLLANFYVIFVGETYFYNYPFLFKILTTPTIFTLYLSPITFLPILGIISYFWLKKNYKSKILKVGLATNIIILLLQVIAMIEYFINTPD
jgi:hypothetical protein